MNAGAMFAWWSLLTWLPSYLVLPAAKGGRGMTIGASTYWILLIQVGMTLGQATFGYFADIFGTKRVYLAYLLIAALAIHLFVSTPTSVALALGVTWNVGRGLSAPAPWVVGAPSARHGLGSAFWVSSAALIAAAAIALARPDTTSGRQIRTTNDQNGAFVDSSRIVR